MSIMKSIKHIIKKKKYLGHDWKTPEDHEYSYDLMTSLLMLLLCHYYIHSYVPSLRGPQIIAKSAMEMRVSF